MQVAGSPCFVCEKPVGTLPDVIGCQRCQKVAHRACGTDRHCPTCGESLVAGSVLHASPTPREDTDDSLTGIRGSLLVFVVWIGANVVFQIVPAIALVMSDVTESERLAALAMVGAGVTADGAYAH